jgi:UTP--glucose-1-phosphate uridylyltransferase
MAPAVRRAVIPAAGRGTRMLPFSLAIPKELAPLGSTPAIHFVLDEAAAAGIDEAIVVVSPGKALLREHLELAQAGGAWPTIRLRWAAQEEPTGLADAIAVCAPLLENEPFALLLPDNVPLAPDHRLATLLDVKRERGASVVGVIEIDARWSGLFGDSGRIDWRPLAPGVVAIDRLHDKRPGRFVVEPSSAPLLRAVGRYVLGPDFFERLETSRRARRPGGDRELDEVPAVQALALDRELVGALLPMPLFDVGHPSGLLAASAHLAGRKDAAPTSGAG